MRRGVERIGAVDFGSREVRVLVAEHDPSGAVTILGHGRAPSHGCVLQGVVQDRDSARHALRTALQAAEKEAGAKVKSLFSCINGRNVETLVREARLKLTRGVVDYEDIQELRDNAAKDLLEAGKTLTSSVTAQEWYVNDLRVQNPFGVRGEVLRTRIHFARIPQVIEDNLAEIVASQHRELEDMIFAPLAAALGCLTPEDTELGVGVIDLGRSTTGVAVYRDGRIMGTASFEWGGYHITRDVAAGLHVSFEEADELILEYGVNPVLIQEGEDDGPAAPNGGVTRVKLKTAVSGASSVADRAELDAIIFERCRELLTKVRQHLVAQGLAKHLIRGVVLTGGSAAIKNYTALAESIFEAPCRKGTPCSLSIRPQAVQTPEFAAAAGAARHAFQYRAAARGGYVALRGGAVPFMKRVGRMVRKYFL